MGELKLKTDFRDFYDHAFDAKGETFLRLSKGGMSRREMVLFLERLGFATPRHGVVSAFVPELLVKEDSSSGPTEVVVYLDEAAHRGEGKVKLSATDALASHPGHLCSEYLPTAVGGIGTSLRYLQVGSRRWWLRYWSETDWRSNVGEGGTEVLREMPAGYHPQIQEPMFAIDFLVAGRRLVAIDYNTAPGLAPLRDTLTPTEIVSLLAAAIERDVKGDTHG